AVRADAERERDHRDEGEPRRPAERAAGVARILRHLLDRGPAPDLARRFPDDADIAELETRRARRFVGILAACDAIGDGHAKVSGELLLELFVLTPPPDRKPHASLAP